MTAADLRQLITERRARIGVVGLGMVGLPVACMFADAGYAVVGVELRAERVEMINAGRSPIAGDEPELAELLARVTRAGRFRATTDYADLAAADVITINVETPVGDDHVPHYAALTSACRSLGGVLKRGALVIVESTVAPGTTDGLVRALLEQGSGLRAGADFLLGACPERITPGRLLHNLRHVSRVCGGTTPDAARAMAALYSQFVAADVDEADALTAEIVKTAENAYRDVQIAFANEVAQICEVAGADVWKVRELVNKTPARHMHMPGAGVGGHCIPKDSWLLAYGARGRAPLRVIPAARAVNESMPAHMVDLLAAGLQSLGRPLAGARTAVLGYAYLENSDDTRNSPSEALVNLLRERGVETSIHDPYVVEYAGDVLNAAQGCDAVVVMVAHSQYRALDLGLVRSALRTPLLVDGRHVFRAGDARAAGLTYRAVGEPAV